MTFIANLIEKKEDLELIKFDKRFHLEGLALRSSEWMQQDIFTNNQSETELMRYIFRLLRNILTTTKTIAMVGLSMNETRPSYFVGRYLHMRGYKIIPVNAGHGGKHFFGQVVVSSIEEIDEPVDMIDIFRKPEAVPQIVDDCLAKLKGLKTIWMQIGITHESAALKARQAGLNVIENRCPKIEHQRLFGELRKAGFATNIISSRL